MPEALRLLTKGYDISTANPQANLWVLVSLFYSSLSVLKEIEFNKANNVTTIFIMSGAEVLHIPKTITT